MTKKINKQKSLSTIYNSAFFEELYEMLSLKDSEQQKLLEKAIYTAANNYSSFEADYLNHVPDHKAQEEINKISNELKSIKKRLPKIFKDQSWLSFVGREFLKECKQKQPELKGLVSDIEVHNGFFTIHRYLTLLSVMDSLHTAFEQTGKKHKKKPFKPKKFDAIEHWLTSFSSVLEYVLSRPLRQRRYEPNEGFIKNKGTVYDSDILLFILKPICPSATLSQMERAIKETKEERLNPPWEGL